MNTYTVTMTVTLTTTSAQPAATVLEQTIDELNEAARRNFPITVMFDEDGEHDVVLSVVDGPAR